jgi:hypothetical protein
MKDKFITIYNILTMIETKGEQTKMMSDCLRFIEQCIYECEQELLQQDNVNNSEA